MKRPIASSLVFASTLLIAPVALAVPVTVTVNGTGDYYDHPTSTGTTGVSVTTTYTFDTDNVPPDYTGGIYPGSAYYLSSTDWITAEITLNGGTTVVNENTTVPTSDLNTDAIYIADNQDNPNIGYDEYDIWSRSYSPSQSNIFGSESYINEYIDDILQGVDPAQPFSWTDNDASDYGHGEAFYYHLNGSTLEPYGSLSYTVSSMSLTVSSVPEPSTLALMGIGLIGVVTGRKRFKH